jgi:hypothetical protein
LVDDGLSGDDVVHQRGKEREVGNGVDLPIRRCGLPRLLRPRDAGMLWSARLAARSWSRITALLPLGSASGSKSNTRVMVPAWSRWVMRVVR